MLQTLSLSLSLSLSFSVSIYLSIYLYDIIWKILPKSSSINFKRVFYDDDKIDNGPDEKSPFYSQFNTLMIDKNSMNVGNCYFIEVVRVMKKISSKFWTMQVKKLIKHNTNRYYFFVHIHTKSTPLQRVFFLFLEGCFTVSIKCLMGLRGKSCFCCLSWYLRH